MLLPRASSSSLGHVFILIGSWTLAHELPPMMQHPARSLHETLNEDADLAVLDDLLRHYDRRVTPDHHLNAPTIIRCEIYLRSFGAVNPSTMDYDVDLYLRQTWEDRRLQSGNLTRPLDLNDPSMVKRVWRPDVYFPNAKSGEFQFVTVPNVLVRITPTGSILYMLRLKLTFSCMMDMERYPLDSQICTIELSSFSKTTREVELRWLDDQSVTLHGGIKMAQFELKDIRLSRCTESLHIGEYSCLKAELLLKRSLGHHLVQSYLPSTLIVVISWVSFWLDVDAIPARITLGVTTLLTISSESSDQQAHLAPVSYVKALDVWMGTCTMFVFAALLEFTLVNYMARKRSLASGRQNIKETNATNNLGINLDCSPDTPSSTTANDPVDQHFLFRFRSQAKRIDQSSRVIFPVAFVLFNALYWPYYLN